MLFFIKVDRKHLGGVNKDGWTSVLLLYTKSRGDKIYQSVFIRAGISLCPSSASFSSSSSISWSTQKQTMGVLSLPLHPTLGILQIPLKNDFFLVPSFCTCVGVGAAGRSFNFGVSKVIQEHLSSLDVRPTNNYTGTYSAVHNDSCETLQVSERQTEYASLGKVTSCLLLYWVWSRPPKVTRWGIVFFFVLLQTYIYTLRLRFI